MGALLSHTLMWRCFALFAFSLILWVGFRSDPLPQYTDHFDKWAHALAFAGLTGTFLLAFPRWPWLAICSFMVLLGFGIEVGQDVFLPKRTFDWGDFGVDVIGVILGTVITHLITSCYKSK